MRTRSRESGRNLVGGLYFVETNNLTGSTTVHNRTPAWYGESTRDRMTDTVTNRFAVRRKRGEIISNPVSATRLTELAPAGIWDDTYLEYDNSGALTSSRSYREGPKGLSFMHAPYFGTLLRDLSDPALDTIASSIPVSGLKTKDELIVAAAAKAASTPVLSLVTAAEMQKTLDSADNASKAFTRISTYIKRHGRKLLTPSGALRLTGDGLRTWLEVRYGILPTYYDLLGYAEQVSSVGKKSRRRFVAVSTGTGSDTITHSDYSTDWFTSLPRTDRSLTRLRSAGLLVEPFADNIGHVHSLGIDRLASSAWELVPLSFVVDWFFNTSQTIAAHEGRFGQRVLTSWYTDNYVLTRSNYLRTIPRTKLHANGTVYRRGLGVFSIGQYETCNRYVREINPRVPIIPSAAVRLSTSKIVDLIALTAGLKEALRKLRV